MSNSTCGHCGARLPAPTGGGASLIRCKTCGRRAVAANQASQDAALPPRRRSQPGDVPPSEVVNGAEDPLLQGSLVTHRVPAEEVSGTIRPRPDLLHDVGPDPDRRRKVVVAIVLAVAALCSVGTAVFLTLRQPQRQQQRQDAQVFVIATPPGTPNYPGPGPNGQGTPAQPVSTPLPPPPAAPAPPTPPAPPQSPASPTSLASSIEASNDLCNSSIFLSSEVALREFEDLYPRLKPDAVHAELKAILGELGKDGVNEFELLSRIRAVQASEWLRWYRPAFTILFRSQIKQPVGAEVRVACKDAFAKSLFVGGLSSRPDAKLAWNPADGTTQLPFQLGLDPSAIYDLKAPLNVNLEFQVEYEDGSRETPIRHEVRVHPVGYVELGYPFGYSFAAIVDEDHPMVKDLINKISSSSLCRRTDVAMGEGGVDLRAMFLVWRELRARGIR